MSFSDLRTSGPRTPLKRIVAYKAKEFWRKVEVKWLRALPAAMQDRKLEKKYRTIMGVAGAAPELAPGGAEAAIGEATRA